MEDQTTTETNSNEDYIAAINELKANTVAREDYEKIRAENKKLLESLIQGVPQASEQSVSESPNLTALRKDLFGGERDLSNLEYAEEALALRKALIDNGERDPFMPFGKGILLNDEADIAAAERVAESLQHCIDVAEGDNAIFTTELQRIMIDSNPIRRK